MLPVQQPPARALEAREMPLQRLPGQGRPQLAAGPVRPALGHQAVVQPHRAVLFVERQPLLVHAHHPAGVAPQVHHRARLTAGDRHAQFAQPAQHHHAEAQVGGGHVGLAQRQPPAARRPLLAAAEVTAHQAVHQPHPQGGLEALAETVEATRLGAVDPPFAGFRHATGGALAERAGEHQRLVEAGQQIAAHQRQIAQHIGGGEPGAVDKAGALVDQRRIHPVRAAVDTLEERPQRFRRRRHRVDALLQGLLEQRPPLAGAVVVHPVHQGVHGRVTVPQGLGHRLVLGLAGRQRTAQKAAQQVRRGRLGLGVGPGAFGHGGRVSGRVHGGLRWLLRLLRCPHSNANMYSHSIRILASLPQEPPCANIPASDAPGNWWTA